MKPLAALLIILVAISSLFYVLTQTGNQPDDYVDTPIEISKTAEPETTKRDPGTLANPNAGTREVATAPVTNQERTEASPDAGEEFDNQIKGIVLNTAKQPVADAKVTLTQSGLASMLFVNGDIDRSKDRVTTTDEEGRYSFTQVEPFDRYSIEGDAEGYSRAEVPNISMPASGTLEAPPILLSIGASLSGTITDTAGNPVPGATLQLDGMFNTNDGKPGVDSLIGTTDDSGKYLIANVPVGNRSLSIRAEGYANSSRTGLVFRGEEPLTLDVTLDIAEMICGRVISNSGQPIEGAAIYGINFTNSSRQSRDWAESDANGEFCLTSVAAGQYTIQVSAKGFRPQHENRVKTGNANLVIEMVEQGTVSGRIIASDGAPPTPYKVQLRQVHAGNAVTSAFGPPVTYNEGDGSFTLECGQGGVFKVEGIAKGYAPTYSEEFRFTNGQSMSGIVIRMSKGGTISGTVVDTEGNPIPKARITTHSNDWTNSLFDRALGDQFPTNITNAAATGNAKGKFSVPNLHPETYQIRINAPGFCEGTQTDIFVTEGKDTATGAIQLIRGGEITGTVIDLAGRPVVGAIVRLSPERGGDDLPRNYEVRAGADGTYTIRNIFPGKYNLNASLNNENSIFMSGMSLQGDNQQPVAVQDGQSQQFELKINS